jgi:hypothetical protein
MHEVPPRVFVSYSHDGAAHQQRVLHLADRLRHDGVDAIVDQYEQFPSKGWPSWCEAEIRKAGFVLMVCTPTYMRRVGGEEEPGNGLGVLWEAKLIKQLLYDTAENTKFVPVLFDDGSRDVVPVPVKGYSTFEVATVEGYEELYRLLTDQPRIRKPKLGTLWPMPVRQAQWTAEPPSPPQPAGAAPEPSKGYPGFRPLLNHVNREDLFPKAVNYEEVDFANEPEVAVDNPRQGMPRSVLAQIDFEECLYVESARVRVVFGVKRAYLLIFTLGNGKLQRVDHLQPTAIGRNVSYKKWQDRPEAICICIEPDTGKLTLGSLALPKWEDANRLSLVATASSEVRREEMRAELHVALNAEQIYIVESARARLSGSMQNKLHAIIKVAASKTRLQTVSRKGHISRSIEVTERKRGV